MFEEAFGPIKYCELSSKLPKNADLYVLKHDSDVLNMCEKLNSKKFVYVYVISVSYGDQH